tara:strand:+ start:196 stop:399 length:204 start_codon:yes stop_codon:yes gene_type:complete
MGGAMNMPTRNTKAPSRTRFKMGGGNFPDADGSGDVTMKDVLIKRGVIDKQGNKVKKGYGGTHRKKK